MNQVYIDMDGVVADFDQAIVNIFGEEYSDKIADKFWKQTCVEAEVFRKMPEIEEGLQMVESIHRAGVPICFMTSTGGLPHHMDIAKQKIDWLVSRGHGKHPIAFCMNTKGKGLYAHPGAVLIDDREKVVEAWVSGGGDGLLFTRDKAAKIAHQVIEHFGYLAEHQLAPL